jgi:hypothetical protein
MEINLPSSRTTKAKLMSINNVVITEKTASEHCKERQIRLTFALQIMGPVKNPTDLDTLKEQFCSQNSKLTDPNLLKCN